MTRSLRVVLLGLALAGCSGSATQRPDAARNEPATTPAVVTEGASHAPTPASETKTMTAQSDPVAELLHLPDAEYFTVSEARLLELQAALSQAVEGSAPDPAALPPRLALGAPARVSLTGQPKVPVLLGSFQTGLRAWQVNFRPNLWVLAKHHASGELVSATPLVSTRRARQPRGSGAGTPPDELNATATRSGVDALDLRERLGDWLRPGTLSVTAVAYDIRSNTVALELEGEAPPVRPATTPSPLVRHELDMRPLLPLELEVPASGSARAGIKVRVAVQTTRDDAIVRTEFNQPLLSGNLILVRLDEKPVIVPAFVPVQPVQDSQGKPAYNALFIVELGAAGHPIATGAHQVYLDLGGELHGPFPLTVTD
jgi:hypothetical protein